MPRGNSDKPKTTPNAMFSQWWAQTGAEPEYVLHMWDPDTAVVVQSLLELLSDGLTVVFRPGSGGRSIGMAVWQGDNRPPAKWLYDQDEWNAYAENIVKAAAARRNPQQLK